MIWHPRSFTDFQLIGKSVTKTQKWFKLWTWNHLKSRFLAQISLAQKYQHFMNEDFLFPALKIAWKLQRISRKAVSPSSAWKKWPRMAKNSPKMTNKVENWVSIDSVKNLTTNVTYGLIIFGIDPIYIFKNDFWTVLTVKYNWSHFKIMKKWLVVKIEKCINYWMRSDIWEKMTYCSI